MAKHDWNAIRIAYENAPKGTSLSAFAAEKGIDKSLVSRKIKAEGWSSPCAEHEKAIEHAEQSIKDRARPWPVLVESTSEHPEPIADPDLITDDKISFDIIEIQTRDDQATIYRDMVEQHRAEVSQIDKFRQATMHIAGQAVRSNAMDDWKLAREATGVLSSLMKALDQKQRLEIRAWRHDK
jgi:hypothetical protein